MTNQRIINLGEKIENLQCKPTCKIGARHDIQLRFRDLLLQAGHNNSIPKAKHLHNAPLCGSKEAHHPKFIGLGEHRTI